MRKVLLSSNKQDWETPQDLFDALNREFKLTIDVCANEKNRKCERFFSEEDDGLKQNWEGETVWCNPPYTSKLQDQFVEKCFYESKKPGTTCVMLIPARTDTDRFHRYIYGKAEVRFIKGRLHFSGEKNPAPFPSMIVIYK